MATKKYVRYRDCNMGEQVICQGACTVTLESKTGRKARLKFESDSPIQFIKPQAHMCHDSLEGDNHDTNRLRR
jgi:hypothetical protein